MSLTDDPNDPRLTRGVDTEPVGMASVYLVLSDLERGRGFVRPVRQSYKHVGPAGPTNPLRDLTADEHERYDQYGYIAYEEYPDAEGSVTGRFWTEATLAAVGQGCGAVTTMNLLLAETYARDPRFYGSTYCVGCSMHLLVGPDGEFVWVEAGRPTDLRVGA